MMRVRPLRGKQPPRPMCSGASSGGRPTWTRLARCVPHVMRFGFRCTVGIRCRFSFRNRNVFEILEIPAVWRRRVQGRGGLRGGGAWED
eukprot:363282-Chlamydomonas_euryale.AAC.6